MISQLKVSFATCFTGQQNKSSVVHCPLTFLSYFLLNIAFPYYYLASNIYLQMDRYWATAEIFGRDRILPLVW